MILSVNRYQKMTEREKQELRKSDKVFAPPLPKKIKTEELLMRPGGTGEQQQSKLYQNYYIAVNLNYAR